jgi:ABC-type bacteriocin/lantibiotic exporter with double-glycine peptidase domain
VSTSYSVSAKLQASPNAREGQAGPPQKAAIELSRFIKSFRGVLIGLAFLSAVINLLVLNGTIFMLEVYDRVLPRTKASGGASTTRWFGFP